MNENHSDQVLGKMRVKANRLAQKIVDACYGFSARKSCAGDYHSQEAGPGCKRTLGVGPL